MIATQQAQHWRDSAIEKSEVISDAWEVGKAYAGRAAEVVLFACMFINIVEMVPTIHVWGWLTSATLIVQAITLDVAGFGLSTMADYAHRAGDEQAARQATTMSRVLISLMIATLVTVAVKLLFPQTATVAGYVDDGLILARIVATVFYGHVMHTLRRSSQVQGVQAAPSQELQALQEAHAHLQEAHTNLQQDVQALRVQVQQLQQEQAEKQQVQQSELPFNAHPRLRALPSRRARSSSPSSEKFNAREFVYSCLQENDKLTLPEIEQRALAQQHKLSQSSISRYRTQFFASRLSTASMQVANQ